MRGQLLVESSALSSPAVMSSATGLAARAAVAAQHQALAAAHGEAEDTAVGKIGSLFKK